MEARKNSSLCHSTPQSWVLMHRHRRPARARTNVYPQMECTEAPSEHLSMCPHDVSSSTMSSVRPTISSSWFESLRYSSADTSPERYTACIILHASLSTLRSTLEAWDVLSSFVSASVQGWVAVCFIHSTRTKTPLLVSRSEISTQMSVLEFTFSWITTTAVPSETFFPTVFFSFISSR